MHGTSTGHWRSPAALGGELEADADWKARLTDETTDVSLAAITIDGATLRVQRRVAPPGRPRRGGAAPAARRGTGGESIETVRWDVPASRAAGPG
jgi:hypothetical protein